MILQSPMMILLVRFNRMYRSLDYILPNAGIKEKFKFCEKNGFGIAFLKVMNKQNNSSGFFNYIYNKIFGYNSDYVAFAVMPDLPQKKGSHFNVLKALKYKNEDYQDDRFFDFNEEFQVSISLPESVQVDVFGVPFINCIDSLGNEVSVFL
ncbi:hypothetical protein GUI12_01360 [Anaplasmataceae bacterium AB001_6]|nr:hypothetical protein GUI12_01360 [Anaplasmataceae bacterium AB001_6]